MSLDIYRFSLFRQITTNHNMQIYHLASVTKSKIIQNKNNINVIFHNLNLIMAPKTRLIYLILTFKPSAFILFLLKLHNLQFPKGETHVKEKYLEYLSTCMYVLISKILADNRH